MDSPAGSPPNPPIRVLALDDEPAIRKMYQSVLVEGGFEVETAENGRQALKILLQKSVDVLLVDLCMPEMDGFAFLQEALNIWPWVGVVIVSGYVTDEAVEQAARLGVKHVLHKPVSCQALWDAVRSSADPRRDEGSTLAVGGLSRLCEHLRFLTRLSEKAIGTQTLVSALRVIGASLPELLPCDVVGVMSLADSEEERVIVLTARRAVHEDLLSAVRREMLTRYSSLTGVCLQENSLRAQTEGVPPSASAPAVLGSILSVPVLVEQDIQGLLTLASIGSNPHPPEDVCLLYHAANHISGILVALRGMRRLATQDGLTGVLNRSGLEETLERTWLISRRYGFPMAVVVADLDHFKAINDAYGHMVGDQVLREFSEVVEGATRASDIVARYGGDEFVAILPSADENAGLTFAERLLAGARDRLFCASSLRLRLTISVGVATTASSSAPATSGALLCQADRALYMAKRAGRNRTCLWPGRHVSQAAEAAPAAGRSAPALPAAPTATAAPVPKPLDRAHIMVVDDEASICGMVSTMLRRERYRVTCFESGDEALDALRAAGTDPFDVVITDLHLPGLTGLELLQKIDAVDDTIVKIVMTGYATVDNAVISLREGAYDFIQKPIDREHLLAVLNRAVEYRDLRLENARYQARLEELVRDRSAQLAASLEEVKKAHEFTLEAMVAMLDARERQTAEHGFRVRDLAVRMGEALRLRGDALDDLGRGALLHDVGKISVPDAVLLKPGPLTPEEWRVMRQHPETGYRILNPSPYLKGVAEIVRSHHERFDGTGYPRGLRGDQICAGARVFAVIDAYEAMRSSRVYRDALTPDEAAAEIELHSGSQFDPEIVRVMLSIRDVLEAILSAR